MYVYVCTCICIYIYLYIYKYRVESSVDMSLVTDWWPKSATVREREILRTSTTAQGGGKNRRTKEVCIIIQYKHIYNYLYTYTYICIELSAAQIFIHNHFV
jgi:hypothetical protein